MSAHCCIKLDLFINILSLSLSLSLSHARAHTRARGRTPLHEWSARRTGRYLHNIWTYPCTMRDSNPRSQWLQPTYTQTARPRASPVRYSYWTALTATLLCSSRVTEVWVRSRDFSGHAMKAYAGSRSIASSFKHPYPRYWMQVCCQLHAPAALLPWNDPLYPFHRSLGEPIAGLDVFEERITSCFWWHSNPVPTALPRLPLCDRVYHSPSQVSLLLTVASLHCHLPNDYEWKEGQWIYLHVFQIRYIMEMNSQHCEAGPTTVRTWRTKYLPVR